MFHLKYSANLQVRFPHSPFSSYHTAQTEIMKRTSQSKIACMIK